MKLKTLLGAMFVNVPILISIFDKNDPSSDMFPIGEFSWKECFNKFGNLDVMQIFPSQDRYVIDLYKKDETK